MFYLTKRTDEKQCNLGDVCMVLADFSGIPAGTRGVVTGVYSEGVMITWVGLEHARMSKVNTVETIGERIARGDDFSAAMGWFSDGFSRDELQYLMFCTAKHPDIDAMVYNYNIRI